MSNSIVVFDITGANIIVDIDTPVELDYDKGQSYLQVCDTNFRFADPGVLEKQGELMIVAAHVMRQLKDKETPAPAEAEASAPTTDSVAPEGEPAQVQDCESCRHIVIFDSDGPCPHCWDGHKFTRWRPKLSEYDCPKCFFYPDRWHGEMSHCVDCIPENGLPGFVPGIMLFLADLKTARRSVREREYREQGQLCTMMDAADLVSWLDDKIAAAEGKTQ